MTDEVPTTGRTEVDRIEGPGRPAGWPVVRSLECS